MEEETRFEKIHGLPNFRIKHEGTGGHKTCKVPPKLLDVGEALALKHPLWDIIACPLDTPAKIVVTLNGEQLGYIVVVGEAFRIFSHRVKEVRSVAKYILTISPQRCISMVNKLFRGATRSELADVGMTQVRTGVVFAADRMERELRAPVHGVWMEVRKDIIAHWDEFLWFLTTINAGVPRTGDSLRVPELAHFSEGMGRMKKAFENNEGVVVVLMGEEYLLRTPKEMGHEPLVYTSATLPTYVRAGVGMLKLVANGQAVINIGHRATESSFYILP